MMSGQETIYGRDAMNEYRLILDTPAIVKRKIADEKIVFDLDYRGTVISGGNPCIYLALFSQHVSKELMICDALEKVAMGFMPFKVHLRNFGFCDGHEVYIALDNTAPVDRLVEQIKQVTQWTTLNPVFNELPRLTLGRRLHVWQFEKSRQLYEKKHFAATFLSNAMLVLKRMEGFRNWQILKHLEFQNQLV
ncbi:MAG TPA: hypothetical protein PK191_03320 [Niabella sp.]|nr:hypothetical protein [Niabella sp.]HOZ95445.1 hypothetical protein [Niabella sp.]HQW14335.1 hypothetical protein [Niabella sp.]HQX18386.1 hypothetical protein [Niabella sp.]HQX40122.1 hypothetical protein [Niabella sp.]